MHWEWRVSVVPESPQSEANQQADNWGDRPRCRGHCCRGFALEVSYAELKQDYQNWCNDPKLAKIPDVEKIHQMVIPLRTFSGKEIYTCKHLRKSGDCGNYTDRPQMCRDFPGPNPCPFRSCASHGRQNFLRRTINWIRD